MEDDQVNDNGRNVTELIHLGREIVGCTAKRPCCVRAVFCKPKVGNFDVSIEAEEDVLGFEITINNIKVMQVVKR